MSLRAYSPGVAELLEAAYRSFEPAPDYSISEWADNHRKLSSEASAEPGQWSTERAEYQREILDTISANEHELVVIMSSAQVGKTEIVNNVAAYHIAHDPCPILVLQPTLDMAETWSKDRLAPMLRDTPQLRDKVADPRARDSGNTLLHKKFAGGHLTIVGANSASGLASRPIRVLLADEVDRYPPSAGTEGDPLALAMKRTTTFWNRRVVVVSTPTTKGLSRVEREWERSDKRRYHVPCKHCDEHQVLAWRQVQWPEGRPDEAAYVCEHCGSLWSEADRLWAVRRGEWRAEVPGSRIAGFHISELYSPWSSMPAIARSFLASRPSYETRKAWVNTCLGEPYEEEAAKLDPHALSQRGEDWSEGLPDGVLVITCGVDVQADRLEVERVGWGTDEESWSLDHYIINGDPSDPNTWARLDAYLAQPSERANGTRVPVRAVCVDSGGHHTQIVYRFCRARKGRRIWAIKGRAEAPTIWPKATKISKDKSQVKIVGVDIAKDAVYNSLRVTHAGPGFCHFPVGRPHEWFEQLTAEVVETRYTRGFPKRVYVLPDGRRNEALDCRVYAYAALVSLGVRWSTEIDALPLAKPAEASTPRMRPEVAEAALRGPQRGRDPWMRPAGGSSRTRSRTGQPWLRR